MCSQLAADRNSLIKNKESFEQLRLNHSDPPSLEEDSIEPLQKDYLDAIPRPNARRDSNVDATRRLTMNDEESGDHYQKGNA